MKDLIEKSKKVLLLFNDSYDVDIYAAVVSMAKVLEDEGKEVNISTINKFPIAFRDLLALRAPNNVDDLGRRRLVVSLNKKEGEVQNVTWSEDDKEVKFVIAPKAEEFNVSDVKFKFIGGNFDLMIMFGINKLEELGKVYQEFKETINRTPKINIDYGSGNSKFGKKNYVNSNSCSVAESLYEALQDSSYEISKEVSSSLLAGILWRTNGLRHGLKNSRTFKNIAGLLSAGAEYSKSIQAIFHNLEKKDFTLVSKIIEKAQEYNDGSIIGAALNSQDIGDVHMPDIISPEFNILSRAKGVSVVFLLTETQDHRVWGQVINYKKDFNVLTKLKDLRPAGSAQKVWFLSEKSLTEVEDQVVEILTGKPRKKDVVKEEPTVKQEISETAPVGKKVEEAEAKDNGTQTMPKASTKKEAPKTDVTKTPSDTPIPEDGSPETSNRNDSRDNNNYEPLKKATSLPEPKVVPPNMASSFAGPQPIPGASPFQPIEPLPKATVPPQTTGEGN